MPRTALLIGLGLIGGSMGIALRRQGWRVHFIDPAVTPEEARVAADARVEAPGGEDVVVLATPVHVAAQQLRELQTGAVITSVCSVMRPLRVGRPNFIAGHPMAGSHEHGFGAADGELFRGKPWFVEREHPLVDELIRDCGGVRHVVTAEEHDAAMALVSHIPQMLSTALAAYLHERQELLPFAGTGLQTFLRLAASDASVWAPVLAANADNIAPHLEEIAKLAGALTPDDFDKAKAVWRALAAQ